MRAVYDVIVIGAGPAGMAAAIYAKRANMQVLMLDKLAPGGQILNTYEIENYPGFGKVNGAELGIKMYEHTINLGIPMEYGTVTKIEVQSDMKIVQCQEGQSYQAKALILATGTKARILGIENEETFLGNGIGFCAICDGAHYKDKKVIVIGGGNSAVEESLYLASMVKHLSLVTLFNLTADTMACDKLRAKANVDVYEFYDIEKVNGEKVFAGITARSTKTGEILTLEADGAFEYIGFEPLTQYLENLKITDERGYVKVDKEFQTAQEGVFAAGDVIVKDVRQVVTACNDGAIAAQNAAKYVRNKIV